MVVDLILRVDQVFILLQFWDLQTKFNCLSMGQSSHLSCRCSEVQVLVFHQY